MKSQIWIAVSVYVIIAIIRKRLQIEESLHTILQILSLTTFEKTSLKQLLSLSVQQILTDHSDKQLNLFPPFHREVRHLQVVEIVVKNFSKMGCDQGATTPSYWAGRLA